MAQNIILLQINYWHGILQQYVLQSVLKMYRLDNIKKLLDIADLEQLIHKCKVFVQNLSSNPGFTLKKLDGKKIDH